MNQGREEGGDGGTTMSHETSGTRMPQAVRSRISMHDGVTDRCDCCSCEAEPYWAEVAEELGIDSDPGVARGGRAAGQSQLPTESRAQMRPSVQMLRLR